MGKQLCSISHKNENEAKLLVEKLGDTMNKPVLEVGNKVGETEGFSREVAQLSSLFLK
jgi:hypothetical protein